MTAYDIITIGGGLGGAAFARSMAERGARVLVLERETNFKDRVRGEGMTSWGSGEARELGIYDLLAGCGHEVPWWDTCIGPMTVMHREMAATTPQGLPTLAFYHPKMQETLLAAAETAGAEVRRGVRAKSVTLGKSPSVEIESDGGKSERIEARLVVAADGRGSLARKWGSFAEKRDRDRLLISGLLFANTSAPDDTVRLANDLEHGTATILFPQGGKRVRTYFICGVDRGLRLQGDKDVSKFVAEAVKTGMPPEYFEGAQAAGPLATFEGADCWVDHPYKDGLALIGDAAAHSDPSWGQGLSLTLRDARELRDALSASDDWDAAGHAYAKAHDGYYNVIHTVEDWLTQFFYETGPEADARRQRAFPLIAQDPTRVPDAIFSGPESTVLSEETKRRFFAEE
jgi:2-polyprenyl-6-methoxyphenol hydroxylase-like FAD-dependent oxidoreductase